MTFYLGIDGGGTGCRAALADAQGRIVGQGSGGPANINTDVQGAARSIMAATTQALRGIAAAPGELVATLGLAGGTISTAARTLTDILPFARIQIVNDGITAARGALGPDDGILAALGTGSVFAVQRAGQIRQVGGRGFLLGDEGSGAVLGRALLSEAMRAEDGFAPMSPLLRQILEEFGGIEGIIRYGNTARPVDFGALAPRIVTSDDPAAQRLFEDAVAQVRHILATLQDGRHMPVVFVGGLGPFYQARLEGLWPVHPPLGSSLDGAIQMARQLGSAE
jgi:glucosamine kinase